MKKILLVIAIMSFHFTSISQTAQKFLIKGNKQHELKNFKRAINYYSKSIELDSLQFMAFYGRGFCKEGLGDYVGAIKDYSIVIRLNSNFWEGYYKRGDVKLKLNDYKGSIKDMNKAIEVNSEETVMAYALRGSTKALLEDFEGAVGDYTIIIEKFPDFKGAYYSRAFFKTLQRDFNGAYTDYSIAIDREPMNGMYYGLRGNVNLELGESENACKDWFGAIEKGYLESKHMIEKYCN